jgi:hypothetical protein
MMTGQPVREDVHFPPDPDLLKQIMELLKRDKDLRLEKHMERLLPIVSKIPYFQTLNVPYSHIDFVEIIKHFKYEYFPAGSVIRRAG